MSGPQKNSRATLKDVARASGYHFTTVSLALRGHASIPEATRTRIAEVAESLGYERNPVFSVLSRFHVKGRVRASAPRIAYVTNYGFDCTGHLFPHMQAIWKGAEAQARLLGYELEHLVIGEDHHDSASLELHLKSHGIAAVIVSAFQPGFADIAINWDNYAVVKINSAYFEPRATMVCNDNLREIRLAFRKLTELGYQRVGLAIGRADDDGTRRRHTAGYLLEQSALPPERRIPPLLFPYNYEAPAVTGLLGRWVRRHQVDAVMCNWYNIDEMLAEAGLRIPQDVACACTCLCDPVSDMAGVRPDLCLVGERAVSLIATQLKAAEHGVPEFASVTYVQSTWQDGPTAPPIHA